jgi:hypothetical protein
MPDQSHDGNDDIVNAETQHEKSDVNVRALGWAVVIFIVFAAATYGLLYLQFHFFARHFRGEAPQPLTMMTLPSDASVPVTPRLQPFPARVNDGGVLPPNANTPVKDMEEMRVAEEQVLNNPGWIDQEKGIVRLPIDVAKQLMVQRLSVPVAAPGGQPPEANQAAEDGGPNTGAKP